MRIIRKFKLVFVLVLGIAIGGGGAAAHAVTQPAQPYDFGVTYVVWSDYTQPSTLFVRVTHNGRSVRYRCNNPTTGFQQAPDGSFRDSYKSDPSIHCPIG